MAWAGAQNLGLLVEWWVFDVTGVRWLKINCNNENSKLIHKRCKNIMATLTEHLYVLAIWPRVTYFKSTVLSNEDPCLQHGIACLGITQFVFASIYLMHPRRWDGCFLKCGMLWFQNVDSWFQVAWNFITY